jgi:hemin uptake protein HemP
MSAPRQTGLVPPATANERPLTLRRDAAGAWATTSEALLGGEGRLTIHHGGESYQLRLTRQNKLILTK